MRDEPLPDLMSYARNVHSQNGEDGVLVEVFERLGVAGGFFCEFGAWDGVLYSNCRVFSEAGWSGMFIESNEERFRKLRENYAARGDRIITLSSFIECEGENSLDEIFKRHGVTSLDLLSVDIDGDDLAIWRSLTTLRSRVVIIEYNHSIPFDIRYENPKGRRHSSSALSVLEAADAMDYDSCRLCGTQSDFLRSRRATRDAACRRVESFCRGGDARSDFRRV